MQHEGGGAYVCRHVCVWAVCLADQFSDQGKDTKTNLCQQHTHTHRNQAHTHTMSGTRHKEKPGTLYFRVVECRDLLSADPNGYSDPYVKIKVGDKKEKSHTMHKTLNPVWNWDSQFSIHDWNTDLSIEVYDDDEYSSNDFLGFLKFNIKEILQQRTYGGWYRLMDKKNQHHTSGRIFIVFTIDFNLGERTTKEKKSILHWATKQILEGPAASLCGHSLPSSSTGGATPSSSASSSSSFSPSSPSDTELSLFVGSWNVGNAESHQDLSSWLESGHDLYSIGVQECKYDVEGEGRLGTRLRGCGQHFQQILVKNLGPDYVLIRKEELMEIRHYLFARRYLLPRIDCISSAVEATGIGGVVGNKGGVAIGLNLDDVRVCFITAHLAAHQDRSTKRNEDVRDIMAGLKMNARGVDVQHAYHHVFFSGDLNYRLNGPQGDAHSPTKEQFDAITSVIHSRDSTRMEQLFEQDQLVAAMRRGEVFRNGWIDAPFLRVDGAADGEPARVNIFAPTFKVQRGIVGPEYKDQRSPAWCDRVLWRTFVTAPYEQRFKLKHTQWCSAPKIVTSDHKPVFGTFKLPIFRLPLSTDDTLGKMRIKFSRVSLVGVSSYAVRHVTNPLIKFHGRFLKSTVATRHKTLILNGNTTTTSTPPPSTTADTADSSSSSSSSANTDVSSASHESVSPTGVIRSGTFFSAMAATAKQIAVAASQRGSAPVADPTMPCIFTWADSEIPIIESQVNHLARLESEPLILKVLNYTFESKLEHNLSSAGLNLLTGSSGRVTEFDLELEHGGLACGRIQGAFQITWEEEGRFQPMEKKEVDAILTQA